ncbi:chemotaxis protein CheW, partial [Candidatus Endoriftia persephone str. Guaymas]|nr:chemotaxis protein CheW [Candidatus Endoriftia persephone str. Guaymas]
RARFKLEKIEYTPTTVIIVLSIEQGEGSNIVGVVVDGVSDVLDISDSLTRSAPDLGAHINTRFITGMVSEGERMVVLLDVDKLFSPDDLGVLGASG